MNFLRILRRQLAKRAGDADPQILKIAAAVAAAALFIGLLVSFWISRGSPNR